MEQRARQRCTTLPHDNAARHYRTNVLMHRNHCKILLLENTSRYHCTPALAGSTSPMCDTTAQQSSQWAWHHCIIPLRCKAHNEHDTTAQHHCATKLTVSTTTLHNITELQNVLWARHYYTAKIARKTTLLHDRIAQQHLYDTTTRKDYTTALYDITARQHFDRIARHHCTAGSIGVHHCTA